MMSEKNQEHVQYKPREELRKAIIQAFAHHQEVSQIFFFGKDVEERTDRFSDIDMVVCSQDVLKTQQTYRQTFARISPIRSTFLLESTAHQFAEMIMLKAYSPYHKVDFSLVKHIDEKRQFGPFRLMYENTQNTGAPRSSSDAFEIIPRHKDTVYTLQDILFSVARFTKCLFRQHGDMYRRWKSLTNRAFVMLHEQYFGWQAETVKKSLTASETNHLYNSLTPQDHRHVQAIYPPNGVLHLADSYHASFELIIALSRQKAAYFDLALDTAFITYITRFLDVELSRYGQYEERWS